MEDKTLVPLWAIQLLDTLAGKLEAQGEQQDVAKVLREILSTRTN